MGIPGSANPLLLATAAPTGYNIERSLRFNSADSAYLSRTPATAGNRKTWTWAGWVKKTTNGSYGYLFDSNISGTQEGGVRFLENDSINVWQWNGSADVFLASTNAVFRDNSAWLHLVVAFDTTQATAANRIKVYINGTQATLSGSYPTQNADANINAAVAHAIGRQQSGSRYFSGYLADIHFIDGQALTPTSFGEFDVNNVWQPKAYTGSYGTNGFRLDFSDNSAATATTLGKDRAGSNNWTPNNLSVTAGAGNDSLVDSPTNYGTDTGAGGEVRGNYCTWNPLASSITLVNGNLNGTNVDNVNRQGRSTFLISSGKWYWEQTAITTSSGPSCPRGGVSSPNESTTNDFGSTAGQWCYIISNNTTFGGRWVNAGVAYGTASPYADGDIAMFAYDADTGKIWFGKNGTWTNSGNPVTGSNANFTNVTPPVFPASMEQAGSVSSINFGQRQWAYAAPAGFKALCTANLPTPTIANPATAMDVALYTGNGSTQTISGLGFSPDLVWLKARSGAFQHGLFDVVRGTGKGLVSNTTSAEGTFDAVTSFNSDGFTNGTDYNASSTTYVAWTWDAGSSTVTNTSGSISSQVRANASAGFSIVQWTTTGTWPRTVGHGLGVEPFLIIDKCSNNIGNWTVYHKSLGNAAYLQLNTTAAQTTGASIWNSTTPSSTVFSINDSTYWGSSGFTHISYCFAPVAGFSAFGSYTGNGSTDGPFVFCNFRPRWIMFKRTDAWHWFIFDSSRLGYNAQNPFLAANLTVSEDSNDTYVDLLSNGFKLRSINQAVNNNGSTFIYAAFAEHPFSASRAR